MDKLKNKRIALTKLQVEQQKIVNELLSVADLAGAMEDRLAHIERGELWTTPEAMKLAPYFMRIATIESRIRQVRATTADCFRDDGTIKHANT